MQIANVGTLSFVRQRNKYQFSTESKCISRIPHPSFARRQTKLSQNSASPLSAFKCHLPPGGRYIPFNCISKKQLHCQSGTPSFLWDGGVFAICGGKMIGRRSGIHTGKWCKKLVKHGCELKKTTEKDCFLAGWMIE